VLEEGAAMTLRISVIVCAHNEARYLRSCLYSLLAQSRPPEEILVINNASTDETAVVAAQVPDVRVVDEPRKGLVIARERGRRETTGGITQNMLSGHGRKNSHIIALDIQRYISADQSADCILAEIRRQGALSIACHPHHRTTRRIEVSTCYLWDHRDELADMVDVWEAANRDDLFSVTSLKHFPYVANSDFHKPRHLYSWKTLLRCEKRWPAIRDALRSNVDVALTLFRDGSWTEREAHAPTLGPSIPVKPYVVTAT
jgi:glycosyltransferase involved in cell wall biosynthesis